MKIEFRKITCLITLLIVLFSLTGCEKDEENDDENVNIIYETPIILGPANNAQFYSHEQFEIKWELPDNLQNSEIQILESPTPIDVSNTSAFSEAISVGYGAQMAHIFSTPDGDLTIQEPIYVGYRVRVVEHTQPKGYSTWTPIQTFTVLPLVDLEKRTIEVTYNFDFLTEEINHEYYSGTVEKTNYNLSHIASENNLDINSIKVVRPMAVEASFVTLMNDGINPFNQITFGYNESVDENTSVYPFNPLGQISPGSDEESPISAQLYNASYLNLVAVMKDFNMKMSYSLTDESNTQHEVAIVCTFNVYIEN